MVFLRVVDSEDLDAAELATVIKEYLSKMEFIICRRGAMTMNGYCDEMINCMRKGIYPSLRGITQLRQMPQRNSHRIV